MVRKSSTIKDLTTKDGVLWWEKTVEYKFIIDCLSEGIIKNIAPLAGVQEQVGDAISVIENTLKEYSFYIIEFKKELDETGFMIEVGKFEGELDGYEIALQCFTDEKKKKPIVKGHYFIGAEYKESSFSLIARDYFSHDRSKTIKLKEALAPGAGMSQEDFKSYVGRIASHKKTKKCFVCSGSGGCASKKPEDGDGPNGPKRKLINEKDLSLVVAINPHNKNCITFPLNTVNITRGSGGEPALSINPRTGNGGSGDAISTAPESVVALITIEDILNLTRSHQDLRTSGNEKKEEDA